MADRQFREAKESVRTSGKRSRREEVEEEDEESTEKKLNDIRRQTEAENG